MTEYIVLKPFLICTGYVAVAGAKVSLSDNDAESLLDKGFIKKAFMDYQKKPVRKYNTK
jgi:hypothetical protein